ncbi:ABC transporter permease [Paenibacillus agaridevorans]|uniref:ABC transporter permease n=1 Tax=Paenibacillus agaridevorans TaxID=171404 RepID=A0A2R5F4E0_9BACL|nr:carbohydrate ABC transporter permease [Paenibacillus agaridevorans]GBG11483.1 ABC transporter permease [Paenibacillus agaridevorans]
MVRGRSERWFDVMVYAVLLFAALVAVVPLMFVVSMSLTPYGEVLRNGGYVFIPNSVTFDAYQYLLERTKLPRSFGVSAFVTVVGTSLSLMLTMLMAYPLSRRKLKGRSLILLLILFTMLFNGGLIPTYLLVQKVGLLNTVWAMLIPNAVSAFNLLIMKSFFESLPEEIFEAAKIDGAKEWRILTTIVAPLSVPSLVTIGLFYMVQYWNLYFQAVLYVQDAALYPLQVVVRNILMMNQSMDDINVDVTLPTVTLQMAAVVVASLPMIMVYPFIQKYFIKGMLIGAIKG